MGGMMHPEFKSKVLHWSLNEQFGLKPKVLHMSLPDLSAWV